MMACCKNTYKKYMSLEETPKPKFTLDETAYRLLFPDWNGDADEVCDCVCHVKGFSVMH